MLDAYTREGEAVRVITVVVATLYFAGLAAGIQNIIK
jgi:hypothetical protein